MKLLAATKIVEVCNSKSGDLAWLAIIIICYKAQDTPGKTKGDFHPVCPPPSSHLLIKRYGPLLVCLSQSPFCLSYLRPN